MEEQGVVGSRILDEPLHGANNVGTGRYHDGVALVVGEDDGVFALVSEALKEEAREVLCVIDAAAQLAVLAKVVDTDKESLALSGTIGVLERVAFGGTVAELLGCVWRRRAAAMRLAMTTYLAAIVVVRIAI